MSTAQIWETSSTSLENTLELAARIGHKLRGGETIELVSDVGGGKTSFVRGLGQGMGSNDLVHSPSFTLSNEYRTMDLKLHHFDFYRLNDPGILRDELAELISDPKTVVVVEWAGIVEDILPASRLTVRFRTTGETSRQLTFEYPKELGYLILA